jgi:hypothetical protein
VAQNVSREVSRVLSRIAAELRLFEASATLLPSLPSLRRGGDGAVKMIIDVFEAHGPGVLEAWLQREGWPATEARNVAAALDAAVTTDACTHCHDWPEQRIIGDLAGVGQDPQPAMCPVCGRVRRTIQVVYDPPPADAGRFRDS